MPETPPPPPFVVAMTRMALLVLAVTITLAVGSLVLAVGWGFAWRLFRWVGGL